MNTPPPLSETPKPKLQWYEHVWLGLPFVLVAIGGAIGGACGGAAWAINHQVFRKTEHPVWKYVLTGLISGGAFVGYIVLAGMFTAFFRKDR